MKQAVVLLVILLIVGTASIAAADNPIIDRFAQRLETILTDHAGQLGVDHCQITLRPRPNLHVKVVLDCELKDNR